MHKKYWWAQHPRMAFTDVINGVRVGLGVHPGLRIDSMFNLLWLLDETLDTIPEFAGEDYPVNTEVTPMIIGLGWKLVEVVQTSTGVKITYAHELCNAASPARILEFLETEEIVSGSWLAIAKERAKLCKPVCTVTDHANIISFSSGSPYMH